MLPSNRTYGFWLALARIFTGVLFVVHALPKFTNAGAFLPPDGFIVKMVSNGIASTGGPYHDFLSDVVLPNIGIFAQCVRAGEALVGCSLILGLFARLGGIGAMFLMVNYILVGGASGTIQGWTGLEGAVFTLGALNALLPTGRVLGFDALLARTRAPRVASAPSGPVAAEFVEERPLDGPSAPRD
ncbi:MAG TPA: DoxX family protein [Candidatus Baltobacteraceae bacterium]